MNRGVFMRILIIRHGDPDYAHDSLTEKGRREAELLAQRLQKEKMDYIYCSPLGRAQDTAAYTLKATGLSAQVMPWLREFGSNLKPHGSRACWDRLPSEWTKKAAFYDADSWYKTPSMRLAGITKEYEFVKNGLFALLKTHGYENCGKYFRATAPNHDTLVFFCHFGVECVLLSLLFGVSAMPLLHNFCALTSSVTTVVTEEREKGIAAFRCLSFSDISHLYAGHEPPSFQARFCEVYADDTRH